MAKLAGGNSNLRFMTCIIVALQMFFYMSGGYALYKFAEDNKAIFELGDHYDDETNSALLIGTSALIMLIALAGEILFGCCNLDNTSGWTVMFVLACVASASLAMAAGGLQVSILEDTYDIFDSAESYYYFVFVLWSCPCVIQLGCAVLKIRDLMLAQGTA